MCSQAEATRSVENYTTPPPPGPTLFYLLFPPSPHGPPPLPCARTPLPPSPPPAPCPPGPSFLRCPCCFSASAPSFTTCHSAGRGGRRSVKVTCMYVCMCMYIYNHPPPDPPQPSCQLLDYEAISPNDFSEVQKPSELTVASALHTYGRALASASPSFYNKEKRFSQYSKNRREPSLFHS